MSYTRLEIAKHAEKIGRSGRTLRRWVLKGYNLDDPVSVEKFLAEAERKKTNVRRYQEARGLTAVTPKARPRRGTHLSGAFEAPGNGQTRYLLPANAAQRPSWSVWRRARNGRMPGSRRH